MVIPQAFLQKQRRRLAAAVLLRRSRGGFEVRKPLPGRTTPTAQDRTLTRRSVSCRRKHVHQIFVRKHREDGAIDGRRPHHRGQPGSHHHHHHHRLRPQARTHGWRPPFTTARQGSFCEQEGRDRVAMAQPRAELAKARRTRPSRKPRPGGPSTHPQAHSHQRAAANRTTAPGAEATTGDASGCGARIGSSPSRKARTGGQRTQAGW